MCILFQLPCDCLLSTCVVSMSGRGSNYSTTCVNMTLIQLSFCSSIHLFIYLYILLSNHSFIHPSIHPSIHHSSTHLFIPPFIHSSILPFIHPFIHSQIHPFNHSSIKLSLLSIHSSIKLSLLSIHSSIQIFIHDLCHFRYEYITEKRK